MAQGVKLWTGERPSACLVSGHRSEQERTENPAGAGKCAKTTGLSWDSRRCPASLSPAASDQDELVSPSREGFNDCASTQPRLASGEQKAFLPVSANLHGVPGGRPPAPATTCAALRGGPRCAFARHPKLCAHCSRRLPAFRSEPRSTKCRGQPFAAALPGFGFQTFPQLPPIPTQGAPSRLRERGSCPAVGRRWERRVANDHLAGSGQSQRDIGPRGCHRPGAPTLRLPPRGGWAQHLLLPSSR